MAKSDRYSYLAAARAIEDTIVIKAETSACDELPETLSQYLGEDAIINKAVFSPIIHTTSNALFLVLIICLTLIMCALAALYFVCYQLGANNTALPEYILIAVGAVLAVNTIAYIIYGRNKKLKKIYETVRPYIASNQISYVTDIVALTKRNEKQLISILEHAIRIGLIPNGKLVYNKQVLLTTKPLADYYDNNTEECEKYFQYSIDVKNNAEERLQQFVDYISARSIDIGYIQRDFKSSKNSVIRNEVAEILVKVQQLIFAADMFPDMGDYIYELMDYYLMSSERLLRLYISADNSVNKKDIHTAIIILNHIYEEYVISVLEHDHV